jgi:hypothetical protein
MIIVVEVIGILWENGEIGQKKKKKSMSIVIHRLLICVLYICIWAASCFRGGDDRSK